MVTAINDFEMIDDGDKILLAVSGGKDSAIMTLMFDEIRKRSQRKFSFEAVILDQKQPGFEVSEFRDWLAKYGIPLRVLEEDTYSIVKAKIPAGKTFCGLCSRLRRGILYSFAADHGFSKIALGHHRDDLNETVLMNMFYSGTIASMPPKLRSDDGRNIVIRPLCYVPEEWLSHYAQELALPVIPCNLCGSQEGLRRARIKSLLSSLALETKDLQTNLLAAQGNIKVTQLLDRHLHDFAKL